MAAARRGFRVLACSVRWNGGHHPERHRGLPQSRRVDESLRADLVARLAAAGDSDRAEGQQRYMKSELPFHGVRVPEVRRLAGAVVRDHPLTDPDSWEATVLGIWRAATHREQRYGAIELAYARPYRRWLGPDRLAMVEEMVVTGAWWDYVDQLAGKHMGHLLATYPEDVRPVLLSWAEDDDIWRRRTAILAQLRFKDRTDQGLLFAVIEPSIARKEFFPAQGDRMGAAGVLEDPPRRSDPLCGDQSAPSLPPQQARGHEGTGPLLVASYIGLNRS